MFNKWCENCTNSFCICVLVIHVQLKEENKMRTEVSNIN